MKPTTTQLNTLLASRQYFLAKLFTITLTSGTVLRYCGGDTDITSGGNLYSAGGQTGPYFEKTDSKAKAHQKLGLGSDTLTLDVLPGSGTVSGLSFLTAARTGIFDGADLQMDYAFMGTYGTVDTGCQLTIFKGRIAEVAADRSIVTFQVNDYRELLNQNMPREIFSAACMNTLYDTNCGVNPNTYQVIGHVDPSSTQSIIYAQLAQATGWFDLGKMTFTSGANAGFSMGISSWVNGNPGTLTLIAPLPFTPATNDSFNIWPGCDRSVDGGCTKFANIPNFRGFPYTPAPETAV